MSEQNRMGEEVTDPTLLMILGAARIINKGISTRSESDPLTKLLNKLARADAYRDNSLETVRQLVALAAKLQAVRAWYNTHAPDDVTGGGRWFDLQMILDREGEAFVRDSSAVFRGACTALAHKWREHSRDGEASVTTEVAEALQDCAEELEALVKL